MAKPKVDAKVLWLTVCYRCGCLACATDRAMKSTRPVKCKSCKPARR